MKNFNYDEFNKSLSQFEPSSSNIDDCFSELQSHINKCTEKHAPLRKRTKKEMEFADKPWISASIQRSINNKNNLYVYLQSHSNPSLQRKYNKMKKLLKKVLFAARARYLERQFDFFQNNSKKTWRLINEITCRKKRTRNFIESLKLSNENITRDPKLIADSLNNFFVNIGTNMSNQLPPSHLNPEHFLHKHCTPQRNSFFLSPTCPAEVAKIINSFSTNKASGPDGISAKFFKLGAPALCHILSPLINKCYQFGIFPQPLKLARVIPIFKGGSADTPSNYRPISIISIISKLIEKLTYNRLISFINSNSILTNNQFGFRNGHSTTHAITNIHEKILDNIDNDKHTATIYLDLSKAFDCVNHNILLNKLRHYGIRGTALDFFRSYLSNRKQFTIVNDEISSTLTILCGVPQGSTLGPLLFLLYINDITSASEFAVSLFADDTCLLESHKSLRELERICNRELVHINNWFLANRLTANRTKASNYMLTLGKRNVARPTDFYLKMGNVTLNEVDEVKYLGVIFDNKFNWHKHISYLCSKLSRSVGILSKLRYFTNIPTLIQVYNSLVKSHLCYSLINWGSAGVTALRSLKVLQNRAIRFISRSDRYHRLDLDYVNLRILKLEDLYQHSVSKFMHQYHNNLLPPYFNNFFVAPNSDSRLRPRHRNIHCRKSSMKKSIRFVGPNLWSEIPLSIKNLNKANFNKQLSNFLLALY